MSAMYHLSHTNSPISDTSNKVVGQFGQDADLRGKVVIVSVPSGLGEVLDSVGDLEKCCRYCRIQIENVLKNLCRRDGNLQT